MKVISVGLIGLLWLAVAMGSEMGVGTANYMSQCNECSQFLTQLRHAASGSLLGGDKENQIQSCASGVDFHFQSACESIASEIGLHKVDMLMSMTSTQNHLCSYLDSCSSVQDEHLAQLSSDVLVSLDSQITNGAAMTDSLLLGALKGDAAETSEDAAEVDASQELADNVASHKQRGYGVRKGNALVSDAEKIVSEAAKGTKEADIKLPQAVGKPLHSKEFGASKFMGIMQQRALMQLQMQQQHLMQLQMMRMHLLSVMEQNREIKSRMRHMKRHTPGNCDCCQACPAPPPTAG